MKIRQFISAPNEEKLVEEMFLLQQGTNQLIDFDVIYTKGSRVFAWYTVDVSKDELGRLFNAN